MPRPGAGILSNRAWIFSEGFALSVCVAQGQALERKPCGPSLLPCKGVITTPPVGCCGESSTAAGGLFLVLHVASEIADDGTDIDRE